MKISPTQAIDLENKLNKSEYAITWIELGDILYEWRINPKYYKIKCDINYEVTKEQMAWIVKNIISDADCEKMFTLKIIKQQ